MAFSRMTRVGIVITIIVTSDRNSFPSSCSRRMRILARGNVRNTLLYIFSATIITLVSRPSFTLLPELARRSG